MIDYGLLTKDAGMAALPRETEIFTVDEVAEILRLSRRHVTNLLNRQELKGFRAGKIWRVTKENLQAFIDARDPKPAPPEPPVC